jgi:hypothetical protein
MSAIGIADADARRELDAQPGLPAAARPGQREQPGIVQQLRRLGQHVFTPDKTAQRARQGARHANVGSQVDLPRDNDDAILTPIVPPFWL